MQSKASPGLRFINICVLGSSISHGARRSIRPHRNCALRIRIPQILVVVVVLLLLLLGCNSWVEEGRCVYLYHHTGVARSACAFGWRDQQRGGRSTAEGGAWRRSEVCGGGGCYRASCSAGHCPQNSCAMVALFLSLFLSVPLSVCLLLSVSRVLGF